MEEPKPVSDDQVKYDIVAAIHRLEDSVEVTDILLLAAINALKESIPGFADALGRHKEAIRSGALGQKMAEASKERHMLLEKLAKLVESN